MKKFLTSLILSLLALNCQVAFAALSGDISINSNEIRFSNSSFMEGRTVRIYATAKNNGTRDLLGVVRYFDNDKQIGGDQAISIFYGKTDDVFIDWTPLSPGRHKVAVKIYPFEPQDDDPANNWIVEEINVIQDTDHDGIPNNEDPDDDGDGVNDEDDDFPLDPKEQYDTDGDGIGNNKDKDDDNDGVPDDHDEMPLDPNETEDTDKDGIGNIADTDDDNDGLSDTDEDNLTTNPLDPDTDKDGVNDKDDDFPLDPAEQYDTDGDGIGNKKDTDDDNDKISDETDPFPLNKAPVIKLEDDTPTIPSLKEYTFDATPTYDEDGKVVSFIWDIDGKTHEGNAFTYTFEKPGTYNLKLTVTDDAGQSQSKDFQVNVLNLTLYWQLSLTLLAILLALIIYFKYISRAKNPYEN